MFLFISGVSLVFSADKSLESQGRPKTVRKMLWRAIILYVLGLITYGLFSKGMEHVRWVGVLQRIAICGFAAGMAYLFIGRTGRVILALGLLAGYWALMTFVPVPGIGAGHFAEGQNLANWIDANYLTGRKWDGDHDPEGLLSTLPAIATALLGVFTGEWLKRGPAEVWKKAAALILGGTALAFLGWAWHGQFPIIKKLWTSSFVLVTGGYSMVLLGFFYILVDGLRWRAAFTPFIWIGMNPITLYMADHFIKFDVISWTLLGGPFSSAFGNWEPLVLALGSLGLCLLLAWFLYSRKVFLKV
jgi:predicted acyltransferase